MSKYSSPFPERLAMAGLYTLIALPIITILGGLVCAVRFGTTVSLGIGEVITFGVFTDESTVLAQTVTFYRKVISDAEGEIRVMNVRLENVRKKP